MNGHDSSVLAKEWFRRALSVVVLTDAGMSAEAAMPVFGIEQMGPLTRHLPATFDSAFMYRTRADEAWGWHLWRLAATRKVAPHAGHRALARLATTPPGLIVITPNIDDLHERAGVPGVIHLRGSVFGAQCLGCGRSVADVEVPPDAADRPALPVSPPRCPDCGDVICPEVVRRDDSPWHEKWQLARDKASQCDLLIVVGTTDVDYPQTDIGPVGEHARCPCAGDQPGAEQAVRSRRPQLADDGRPWPVHASGSIGSLANPPAACRLQRVATPPWMKWPRCPGEPQLSQMCIESMTAASIIVRWRSEASLT
jgi:NAD-dependent deacetylase